MGFHVINNRKQVINFCALRETNIENTKPFSFLSFSGMPGVQQEILCQIGATSLDSWLARVIYKNYKHKINQNNILFEAFGENCQWKKVQKQKMKMHLIQQSFERALLEQTTVLPSMG
jgi:hypothetical protein